MEDSADPSESGVKRARPDSLLVPAGEEGGESPGPKRLRIEDSASLVCSPEVKLIQEDLLDILDDSDAGSDRDPAIHDLDSVIKSFEEEIIVPVQHPTPFDPDLTPNVALNELGYLLEASDDELGLPPSFANSGDENSNPDIQELRDITSTAAFSLPFDGELPNYDVFDLGPEINVNLGGRDGGNEEFVMVGGLFDFADNCDPPEVMWRPESLPAV
ncbi:hypothetical protein MLD38_026215 [Melastoma candidum]|uniref:Uncharacterized protein n=1 Tax=Melastoma candidum TaxID=119954 RepID=A0ACB9NYB9_9MYRT|nr:hypothetical protein MLD38_026215 [Melastoma candidum]